MEVVCPKCGRDDQVRKVVSIVSEQSLTYSDTLGTLAGTGSLSSLLAKRLAPPQKPKLSGLGGWWALLLGSLFFLPFAYIILVLLAPIESRKKKIFAASWLIMPIISIPTLLLLYQSLERDWHWLFILVLILGSLLGLLPTIGIFVVPFLGLAEETGKRSKAFQEQLSSWNRAIEKWQRLYYCGRDDGVFLEGDHLVPVEQMHSYLYGFRSGT